VINVSWDDITMEYLPWLSKTTGKTYRLLTESEWEYAARSGLHATFSWGNEVGQNRANCKGCGSQWDAKRAAPVGAFQANSFGLHDMHGNVWEWVQDCYKNTYAGASLDGQAVDSAGCTRVRRGGSWDSVANDLRVAGRLSNKASSRFNNLGFRVARAM
jgi:formylglycine-generating enzyme required for sulfatase activity